MSDSLIIFKEHVAMSLDERESAKILRYDTHKEETWGTLRCLYRLLYWDSQSRATVPGHFQRAAFQVPCWIRSWCLTSAHC